MEGPVCSESMSRYFQSLKEEAERAASIARSARSRGLDPVKEVEIPFADDLAGRVENLVGPPGVAGRIREKASKMSREKLTLTIAEEVARDLLAGGSDKQKALDQATRTGLAILTEGVLVAPLEGIAEVALGRNIDGTDYADIYFAGPIRAAGGTAQAMSVLIADIVRRSLDIGTFKVTDQEVSRYVEEFQLYRNLQYRPDRHEIEKVVRSCPVCINGEGTEKTEVQGNRDLPRVPTNQVRSGICLVIAEGVLLKAKKMMKIIKQEEIKGWEFLGDLGSKKNEEDRSEKPRSDLEDIPLDDLDEEAEEAISSTLEDGEDLMNFIFTEDGSEKEGITLIDKGISPKVQVAVKYIKDLIAGRPVFSHPSRPGGFRLRYGRGRTCGLASIGINPLTLEVTQQFLATGTQIKIERPGKAGAVTPVDSIDGPIVLLDNGDLVRVSSEEILERVRSRIRQITDVGEILIPFGEFAENNHPLVQGSYTTEWWEEELRCALYMEREGMSDHPFEESLHLEEEMDRIKKKSLKDIDPSDPGSLKAAEESMDRSVRSYLREAAGRAKEHDGRMHSIDISHLLPKDPLQAFELSERYSIPLHPDLNLFWHDISLMELNMLRKNVLESGSMENGVLSLKRDDGIKSILIALGCPHRDTSSAFSLDGMSYPILRCLGITEDLRSTRIPPKFSRCTNVMEAVCLLSGVRIREKAPTRIGARMGRPEKADVRKMKPPVHALYPVGMQGGPQRLVNKTFDVNKDEQFGARTSAHQLISSNAIPRLCRRCNRISAYTFCPDCGEDTWVETGGTREHMLIDTKNDAERALRTLGIPSIGAIPHTKGVKGLISREKVPERLEKGILRAKHSVFVFRDGTIRYDMTDITMTHFKPSEIDAPVERLIDMGYEKDIHGKELTDGDQVLELKVQDIVVNEGCGDYLLSVSRFVDDELRLMYGLEPYYNARSRKDLIGALAIGLAPHTSGGVLCRIVGFTKAQGCFGHPYFHAAKRRNCDGDEDAIMLLMDGLINFSKKFLPEKRGGQMDAPLVLSMRLDPFEVDKEAHNVDVSFRYPLDFHNATLRGVKVNEYWMLRLDSIKGRLGTIDQYEGFGFSAPTNDINGSPAISAYKTINVTLEKINRQLELARMIRAVDEDDVAERVLSTHLLPDMIGNLRSFATQSFRCGKCGAKYRRIPLAGRCINMVRVPHPHRCNNKLILTVSEGSVKKYLKISRDISQKYKVSEYLRQRIELIGRNIDIMFPEQYKDSTLDKFM
ncbi:MAG: DNA polymerase II large subunit [Candidatus Thermoplasmatota archaeon]|nr:DNA polymerase II large subunit [Candidatus Thermoplasmatota archaeon]